MLQTQPMPHSALPPQQPATDPQHTLQDQSRSGPGQAYLAVSPGAIRRHAAEPQPTRGPPEALHEATAPDLGPVRDILSHEGAHIRPCHTDSSGLRTHSLTPQDAADSEGVGDTVFQCHS